MMFGRIPEEKFYPWLTEFLNDDRIGTYYTFDIVFGEDGKIKCSRMLTNSVGLITTEEYITAIEEVRG